MSKKKPRERVERAVDDTREWVGRAGGDAADRVGRAWDTVRDLRPSKDEKSPAGARDAAVGDEALFARDRQHEFEKLGHANILVIGQTGVGKSTLINAIFRKPLATTGTGRAVTKVIQKFEDPDVPVTLYDSKGVELGDSKRTVIRDFKRVINNSRRGSPGDHIHLLWYCLNAEQTRVQDYDIDIITAMAEDVPVILVFTQTIDEERADALEKTVLDEQLGPRLEGGRAVRTLAEERRTGRATYPVRGLEELVSLTDAALPEAVKRAFINAQGVVLDLKVDRSHAIVLGATIAAGAAAAAPLPMADSLLLKPVQLGMLASITAVFGLDLTNKQALELIRAAIGQGGMEQAGKKLTTQLAKRLPGGNVIHAAVAAALTGVLGEAYIRLSVEMLRREAAGKPMPDAEKVKTFIDLYNGMLRKSTSESQAATDD